jgi:hypothetical protein
LFHGFTRTHDGDAANVAAEFDALVGSGEWGGYLLGDDGEVVEGFFDEEADYSVAVKDEVCAVGLDIADLAMKFIVSPAFGDGRSCA